MAQKVFLIPNQIEDAPQSLVPVFASGIEHLRVFFVEELKSARRLLKRINPKIQFDQCVFFSLNEHTPWKEIENYFKQVADQDFGIISEAGCPCVADPGADVVMLAHREGREIIPLVGPSSILLALMASGLNGQNFAFNGYLPKEKEDRILKLKELEKRSSAEMQTQIFMEAPYRNESLFAEVVANCDPKTMLCLAVDLMGQDQSIKTLPIREWKKVTPSLHKKPALFLIQLIPTL